MKRTPFKRSNKRLRRTRIRVKGHSSTTELRDEIQAVAREIVIIRDGGCFLRNFQSEITPAYRQCGGYRNDGQLILQAEHLHTRSNARSFADTRLIVCVCQRHHIYYKPQHSDEYNALAKKYIGPQNTKVWEAVRNDYKAHKVDMKLALVALKQELKTVQKYKGG